ncbi:MAG TPA: exodeoxyribonuclease VII large subunit [Solirubrobacteraceae bacterium]|nr:exodeoxyribonuclease VII large subunit [Solirubrobacteraceae bacterium]
MSEQPAKPEGIPGVESAGPFAVGVYAKTLQARMRERARVQLFGEVFNMRRGRGAKVYFELRDGDGAVPCSMWRNDFEKLGPAADAVVDGAQIVVAGGPDYYPGSRTSSPSFSFQVTGVRVAGEGDLLAQLDRLRKTLASEGLFEPQKQLHRPLLPHTIGVVTGEGGKARDDVLAGLHRRGWGGRVVWAFAPVQDRHAAPRIAQALQDLAAIDEVEVIVVARGGGSLADLFAFCDETLCRTVALLRVPVIASVGHHTDRTLIDDVAAVSCSTPTHAAESAVPLHCVDARESMARCAASLQRHGRQAVVVRARALAQLSRAPAEHVARHRARLHQWLREIRAAGRRGCERRRTDIRTRAVVLDRKLGAARGPETDARRARIESLAAAIAAHDPERVIARGYAVVDDREGNLVTTAQAAREAGGVRLFFADADVDARIEE